MNNPTFTQDELWAAIDDQRLRTADLLDTLREADWAQPSLCSEWTIREVAAHLTMQQMGLWQFLIVFARNPGGLNTVIRKATKRQARLPKETFAPAIRAMVGSRKHNFGLTARETLTDILVHSQDIAIPLGRELKMDRKAASWAADRVWSYQGKGLAAVFRNFPLQRMRLVATDYDWQVGEGPEIRGPISALLLLLTGRAVALEQLEGEGLPVLVR
ncbi:MAG: maleylpyruvate isomerase family mycothiol-dependent enzyme [Gulosibacter sp.]|uniref:maleylpyruvate isomerase family mycothiol-dependent enzyme n=1 Tax=Gulosibacter sp. TaxID=2817531 RepID=UPI003F8EFB70